MKTGCSRRQFLAGAAGLTTCAMLPGLPGAAPAPKGFSFVLLGDLHFDRLEHHDMAWLQANKPGDVRQVQDYSRITREITPRLLTTVRETIRDLRKTTTPPGFVLHVGDLVEGLCGTEALAARQNSEALAFLQETQLEIPFVFTKGNHDITGPGAPEAFTSVFSPFMGRESAAIDPNAKASRACHSFQHHDALFCFFDAYDAKSLEWLEAQLARRAATHCFVIIHPPVVPYGARSIWTIYAREREKAQRGKLLDLLGEHNAFVLGGHIHKYNVLMREGGPQRRFVQLAVSSIVSAPQVQAKHELSGAGAYNPDQVNVEPAFSPETEQERRAVYVAEAPYVKHFEYADLPGYAVISVSGDDVEAKVFGGIGRKEWRVVSLSRLLRA